MDVQASTERTLVDAWISKMEDQDLRKLVIEIFWFIKHQFLRCNYSLYRSSSLQKSESSDVLESLASPSLLSSLSLSSSDSTPPETTVSSSPSSCLASVSSSFSSRFLILSSNLQSLSDNYQPSEDHELSHLGNPEPTSFTDNEYEGFIPQENDHRHQINSHPLNSAEAALLQNISEMN
jgi:hypothetical protein